MGVFLVFLNCAISTKSRITFLHILSLKSNPSISETRLEVTGRVDFKTTHFYLTAKGRYFQFTDLMKNVDNWYVQDIPCLH